MLRHSSIGYSEHEYVFRFSIGGEKTYIYFLHLQQLTTLKHNYSVHSRANEAGHLEEPFHKISRMKNHIYATCVP